MGWSGFYSSSAQYPSSVVNDGLSSSQGHPWGPWSSHHPDPWPHHTKHTTTSQPLGVGSDNRSTAMPAPKTPLPVPPPQHDRDLTQGALAAAIVVPILVLFSAIGLAFLCLRKRRQYTRPQDPTVPVVAAAGLKEKLGSLRRHRSARIPPTAAAATEPPILMSEQNNAYYTGLDTSSLGSSRGFSGEYAHRASFEPPPPYIRDPSPPPVDGRARSPFDDPPDHQLFTEDSYANMEDGRRVSDPFVSPAASPMSSRGTDDGGSRRVSDVSDEDRR